MPKQKQKFPAELRFDIVSKDWVIIATGRAKRLSAFKKEKRKKQEEISKRKCPFCNLAKQKKPTLIFFKGKEISLTKENFFPDNWTTIVIPNKYPAVVHSKTIQKLTEGEFYRILNAIGFHEVVITRSHTKQLAQFSLREVKEVIDVYQKRYQKLAKEKFVNYISIFHNHGKEAGASISHPHSQILTTPLIDADLNRALKNSKNFFKKRGKCIYCLMNKWEMKIKKRIVFENKNFLALCPFASKAAFEIIISPKKHLPYFEKITEEQKWDLAEVLKVSLKKLYLGLNNPSYNFYLHTAPCNGRKYPYYHFHWTIFPKTAISAGFEIGTKIEISTVEPEKAADYLRRIK